MMVNLQDALAALAEGGDGEARGLVSRVGKGKGGVQLLQRTCFFEYCRTDPEQRLVASVLTQHGR